MPSCDVLALGSYSLDLIFTGLPGLPSLGKEVVGTGFAMVPGEAYTAALAMHRLGIKVKWAADFGNDEFSRFALDHARREGMDETLFVHHNRPLRRISVAASFPEDRSFITYYDPDPALPAGLKALASTRAKVLFIPGFYGGPLFDSGIKLVQLKKMKVVMDGNSHDEVVLNKPWVAKTIRHLDILLPNADEARRMAGEDDLVLAMRKLGELCPCLVVKDGENGAHMLVDNTFFHAPALSVTPIDTTGAGDSFNAGFLRGWLDGEAPEICLRMGNICGALSTTAPGGTGRFVTMKDIQEYL